MSTQHEASIHQSNVSRNRISSQRHRKTFSLAVLQQKYSFACTFTDINSSSEYNIQFCIPRPSTPMDHWPNVWTRPCSSRYVLSDRYQTKVAGDGVMLQYGALPTYPVPDGLNWWTTNSGRYSNEYSITKLLDSSSSSSADLYQTQ